MMMPLLAALGLTLLGITLVYPLSQLFWQVCSEFSQSTTIFDSDFWRVVFFTYSQALLSAGISGIVGLFLAVAYTEWEMRGKAIISTVSLLCFSLPSIIAAAAIVIAWGRQGFFTRQFHGDSLSFGWSGILLAHTLLNFGLFFKTSALALREYGRAEEIGALSLGLTRFETFRFVTWVKLRGTFFHTAIISFLLCSSSFLIVLLLGGSPRFTSLEVAIYHAVRVQFNLGLAAKFAFFQLCVGLLLYFIFRSRISPIPEAAVWVPIYRMRSPTLSRLANFFVWIILMVVGLVPLLLLVKEGIEGASWLALKEALWPLFCSWNLAWRTAAISCGGGLCLSLGAFHLGGRWRTLIEILSSLPIVVSTTLISLSWMIAYREVFFEWRADLNLIACVQAVGALPIVFRILLEGLTRIPEDLFRSVRSLGVGPGQLVLWLEFPLIGPSLFLALSLAAAFSVGEVGTLLLLMNENVVTLPYWLYRLMSSYRFDQASFVGLILLFGLLCLFLLSERLEKWRLR